jgi:hypothetical protein
LGKNHQCFSATDDGTIVAAKNTVMIAPAAMLCVCLE